MKLERVIGIAFRTVIDVCKSTTVQNAKDFHAYNLIKLSCSNEMCEACLLDLLYCNEIESPDHVWQFQFLIWCHSAIMFINWIAAASYANSISLSQMVSRPRLQQTSEVRVSHTQYPPPICSVIIDPLCFIVIVY